jgi:hypothetical protein
MPQAVIGSPPPTQTLFTIKQLALLDGLGQKFLEAACASGELRHVVLSDASNGARRVLLCDYHAWLRSRVEQHMATSFPRGNATTGNANVGNTSVTQINIATAGQAFDLTKDLARVKRRRLGFTEKPRSRFKTA